MQNVPTHFTFSTTTTITIFKFRLACTDEAFSIEKDVENYFEKLFLDHQLLTMKTLITKRFKNNE